VGVTVYLGAKRFVPAKLKVTTRDAALRVAHHCSTACSRIAAPMLPPRMVAALAPIDAGTAKWALVALEERHVDAAFSEEALARGGQEHDIVAPP